MYSMETKNNDQVFLVKASGALTKEEGENFVKDLKKKIATINPSDYYLVLDGEKVTTSSPEVLPLIEEANQLCLSAPFKHKFMIMSKSATANLQLKRVGKDNLARVLDFVQSYEEVLEKIK